MKMLKAANSIGDRDLTAKSLQRHRQTMELLGSLATPNEAVRVKSFAVKGMSCERVRPKKARGRSPYIILYA
ncbi:MAG: hypothetical protein K5840_07275, partial [Eubacterium sp.]|nr:hypothetical protein [Eubacterium sp.]